MARQGIEAVFDRDGLLAGKLHNYRVRPQQLEMAQVVAATIQENRLLIAEAGTGTGKTFAYLVPALLSGRKTIISTGTKTLQDQLFHRDIPFLRSVLQTPVTVSMLKGRANYVCHHNLQRTQDEGRHATREEPRHLALIASFARISRSGDKSELAEISETAPIWARVTSTRENCLGQKCEYFKECFVMEARRQAQAADVVVVNHHLFFADIMLRDEGAAELLPSSNTVIFDEAHQLPETAALFFGESVSSGQLLELAHDTLAAGLAHAPDFPELRDAALALETASKNLRLALQTQETRVAKHDLRRDQPEFISALRILAAKLAELQSALQSQAERSEDLGNCFQRCLDIGARWQRWIDDEDSEVVRWLETLNHALRFNSTPLSIARTFRDQVESTPRAWIFTSATLAVDGDFSHYLREMGLHSAHCATWDSPFDYPGQALLYLPRGTGEPNRAGFTGEAVAAALPVLRASGGRAFLLFTSLRAMEEAHALLQPVLAAEGFELLKQDSAPRSELLARFRVAQRAVLVGSQSFWEGVDVRGEALSLVVIDKLPFASPDDPVLAARIEHMTRNGDSAFRDFQLPHAVIALKQGAGRLIRDEADRGVLMICDPRLLSRPYGRKILASLPPMKVTRSLEDVEEFFRQQALLCSA
ncbi:MAG: ATP-dependent DNA helicase [Burkholderiales bacterium]